jgi:tetratricopeptide (TPR) repeat protein
MLLCVLVAASFAPCLKAGFLNWDDPIHVRDNVAVKALSFSNIRTIFQTSVCSVYIPLTTLSFAVERRIFGASPAVVHTTNVVLHIAVAVALLFLLLRLGLSGRAAFLAALLFGLHPVHVESVAWITERKDVLFGLFYVLALYHYWGYLQSSRRSAYGWALFFGVLSILAKPMAVSLPWILFLMDWLAGRSLSRRMWWDKAPFFVLIGAVAMITFVQHAGAPDVKFPRALLVWLWCVTFYPRVFFFPVGLDPMRLLPEPLSILNPEYFIAAMVLFLALAVVWLFRKERWVVFAALFYCGTMFFFWRVDYQDVNIVGERFLYIPSLGFCALSGVLLDRWLDIWKRPVPRVFGTAVLAALFAALALMTFAQCRVWTDDGTLWSDVVRRNPRNYIAMNLFALYLSEQGRYDEALDYNRKALAINPRFASIPYHAGLIYQKMKRYDEAVDKFSKAIELSPQMSIAYYERGKSRLSLGQEDLALADLEQAIKDTPDLLGAYNERGVIFGMKQRWAEALQDFNRVLAADPGDVSALKNRGNLYRLLGQYDRALSEFGAVLRIDPHDRMALEQRAWINDVLRRQGAARE